MPEFVSFMGPLHGAAFLVYVVMVMRAAAIKLSTPVETLQMLAVAFVPFGAFFMMGLFKRKAAALMDTPPSPPLATRL
jgi:integral membrane protein